MMDPMPRKTMITGNWKMHKTIPETKKYLEELNRRVQCPCFLAVPFTSISAASALASPFITIGAQNMSDRREGAYTGEISAEMLVDAGARFVLLGHSERRHLFHESNEEINRKAKRALEAGILPTICIGETREERESGQTNRVLRAQIEASLQGVDCSRIVLAYEPVWAIGTGLTATASQAEETHSYIRGVIKDLFGEKAGSAILIQYGGSVKPENAADLMEQPNIDGLLVGGASLTPESFASILENIEHLMVKQ